jgi:hypothetical protein
MLSRLAGPEIVIAATPPTPRTPAAAGRHAVLLAC